MANAHIRPDWQGKDSQVTPEGVYLRRRELLAKMGLGLAAMGAGALVAGGPYMGRALWADEPTGVLPAGGNEGWYQGLEVKRNGKYAVPERVLTSEELATKYNNFYEFSIDKAEVHRLVGDFKVSPWELEIAGEVAKPGKLDVLALLKEIGGGEMGVEERIYRFRCVEAWAMTVPWSGFPMKKLLDKVEPKSTARYARFWSFDKPEVSPGRREMDWYTWPYYEGFDIEELKNEVAFLATGIFGKPLPRQNGAPLRVIMPWKYGLKSIKSIVKIEFVRERPPTFWNDFGPTEYSYYSNVEPDVPHPRWSQATERVLGIEGRLPTKPYNGYGEHVAHLYKKR